LAAGVRFGWKRRRLQMVLLLPAVLVLPLPLQQAWLMMLQL
jgi:hypothetical protein